MFGMKKKTYTQDEVDYLLNKVTEAAQEGVYITCLKSSQDLLMNIHGLVGQIEKDPVHSKNLAEVTKNSIIAKYYELEQEIKREKEGK